MSARRRIAGMERVSLALVIAGVFSCGFLGFETPATWAGAWLFAVFVLLQPALGSLIMLLIHCLTGGQWGQTLRPYLRAGAVLAPWIWLLLVPLLFFPVTPDAAAAADAGTPLGVYVGRTMVALRFALIGGALFFLAWAAPRADARAGLRWVAPAGLIALVFLLHIAAVDWLFALQPDWSSTGFPLIWMTGHTVSGLAAAILFALAAGGDPARVGASGHVEGVEWGNMLLTCVVFWSYIAFTNFLVMWMGNIRHEVAWYIARAGAGWGTVILIVAILHFFVPLLLLFFRSFKKSAVALGALAAALIVLQAIHTAWLIFPSLPDETATTGLGAALALVASGIFLNRYARLSRRQQEVTR